MAHTQCMGNDNAHAPADWVCLECGDHGSHDDPARGYACPGTIERPHDGRGHDLRWTAAHLAREAERRRCWREFEAARQLAWANRQADARVRPAEFPAAMRPEALEGGRHAS